MDRDRENVKHYFTKGCGGDESLNDLVSSLCDILFCVVY